MRADVDVRVSAHALAARGASGRIGSLGARAPAVSVAGVSITPSGRGYLLFGSDAAAYGFGDATPAVAVAGVTRLNSAVVGGSVD